MQELKNKSPLTVSIVLPAKNEAQNIGALLLKIQALKLDAELLLINDGSSDETADIAYKLGAKVITHPYSLGNGAAVKTGARNATGHILIFMDADGQHNPDDIPILLNKLNAGYDMVVGARHPSTHSSLVRRFGNWIYNGMASYMTQHKIEDLTSGFRAVRADKFRKFLYLLPNGFSYPTTSTMAFFRSGFHVGYVPIHAGTRKGQSHIHILKDGYRFFIVILRVGALFSPMRFFLPISVWMFLSGLGNYGYTFFTQGRFTNMSMLLLLSSLFVFLMGIISEQISSLHYKYIEEK
ncbi:MAG: glycosyltransferase family 2 protein [Methylococcaceae bacterium]|nr:glycosyltransferase family 2 protein [Methylococcaceae bacterium]